MTAQHQLWSLYSAPQLQHLLSQTYIYMDCYQWKAFEIELYSNMNTEDGCCISKSWKPLIFFLKITENLPHRLPYNGSQLNHVGLSTLPSSGHWHLLLWHSINPGPFFTFLAFSHCSFFVHPALHGYNLSPYLFGLKPTTHDFSPPCSHVCTSGQSSAQSNYFFLVSYWFTLFPTLNQWEQIGWFANSIFFRIISHFSICNLFCFSWFRSWLWTLKIYIICASKTSADFQKTFSVISQKM